MKLHENFGEFHDLIAITAEHIGIPEAAVKRDYFIVMMLEKLEQSDFAELCVFKGGTSLSKCYPGSIQRFSEDIDLTYIPNEELTTKQYGRNLKKIEKIMSEGFRLEKIPEERNERNKSAFVWFDDTDSVNGKVKLEIGSSVRPDPYSRKVLRTYIQDYLNNHGMEEISAEYGLTDISINTLAIERTFLDKIMAVKRHAICGDLLNKVRHIYDVTMLYERDDIKRFLSDGDQLKKLLRETKETDSFYLQKRNISKEYHPRGAYDFESWERYFNNDVRGQYESLHKFLLYTDHKQDFGKAVETFREISNRFAELGK